MKPVFFMNPLINTGSNPSNAAAAFAASTLKAGVKAKRDQARREKL